MPLPKGELDPMSMITQSDTSCEQAYGIQDNRSKNTDPEMMYLSQSDRGMCIVLIYILLNKVARVVTIRGIRTFVSW